MSPGQGSETFWAVARWNLRTFVSAGRRTSRAASAAGEKMSKVFMRTMLSGLVAGLAATAHAASPSPAVDGFYRYPTIAAGSVVFASEGDLWRVPVEGGVAS